MLGSINEMSEHGAILQQFNQELVKCLEGLKIKRHDIRGIIENEEKEKQVLERNIKVLRDKLNILTANLNKHKEIEESYNTAIQDTEMGFKKILESSQVLLNLAQHESNKLENTLQRQKKLIVLKNGDKTT